MFFRKVHVEDETLSVGRYANAVAAVHRAAAGQLAETPLLDQRTVQRKSEEMLEVLAENRFVVRGPGNRPVGKSVWSRFFQVTEIAPIGFNDADLPVLLRQDVKCDLPTIVGPDRSKAIVARRILKDRGFSSSDFHHGNVAYRTCLFVRLIGVKGDPGSVGRNIGPGAARDFSGAAAIQICNPDVFAADIGNLALRFRLNAGGQAQNEKTERDFFHRNAGFTSKQSWKAFQ
jgi:hypothetical protein